MTQAEIAEANVCICALTRVDGPLLKIWRFDRTQAPSFAKGMLDRYILGRAALLA